MSKWSKAAKAYERSKEDKARIEKRQAKALWDRQLAATRAEAEKLYEWIKSPEWLDALNLLRASDQKIIFGGENHSEYVLLEQRGFSTRRDFHPDPYDVVVAYENGTRKLPSQLIFDLKKELDRIADGAPK